MFGYIKPDRDNLLVKELTLYKSVYCGLCSVLKKEVSFLLPLTLSYDFVFLSMVRGALTKDGISVCKGRCKYNPLKKCTFAISSSSTSYTAKTALILTYLKIEDDLKDGDVNVFKRLFYSLLHLHLKGKIKKLIRDEKEYENLYLCVKEKLSVLSALERELSADIDKLCATFGDIMSRVLSFSLEGSEKAIAESIGFSVGAYIYLIDAIDDYEKDAKHGAYNPLLIKYGSVENVKKEVNSLDITLSLYAKNASLAVALLDSGDFTTIINNILEMGLGREAYKILTKNGERNDRSI